MSVKFEITYEIEDGYVGKSRPQHISVSEGEIEGLDEEDLRSAFWEYIEDHMAQHSPYSSMENEFVAWALSKQEDGE